MSHSLSAFRIYDLVSRLNNSLLEPNKYMEDDRIAVLLRIQVSLKVLKLPICLESEPF